MKKMSFLSLAWILSSVVTQAVSSAELDLPQYPLQTTGFVKPNVMFLIDNSGSMKEKMGNKKNDPKRIDVAKKVATNIVNKTDNVRFCLSKFNYWNGGKVTAECGESKKSIIKKIKKLKPESWTPLAEAYYESVQYFKKRKSTYNSGSYKKSPIQYRCQKNFVIVLTDGLPTYDTDFKGFDSNYDGLSPYTAKNDKTVPFSDGWGGSASSEGSTFYLDDIAKYAYDTDLINSEVEDLAKKSFNDPLFKQQNIQTYTVGMNIDMQMLKDAADYGHGKYYSANNSAELETAFDEALTQITDSSQSIAASSSNSDLLAFAAASSSSSMVAEGSLLFQTRYLTNNWSGELISLEIDKLTGQVASAPTWRAPKYPNGWSNRVILTGHDGGKVFEKGSFSSSDITKWFKDGSDKNSVIDYVRGKVVKKYRVRSSKNHQVDLEEGDTIDTMGDVVNSSPVYIPPPVAGLYSDHDYDGYVKDNANRLTMMYLGANDGMLHGFYVDSDPKATSNGVEKLAYIPTQMLPHLKKLTVKNDFKHRFYVDGTPTVADVYTNSGQWKTILVGGLGRGGQGFYALNVTKPGGFANTQASADSVVLWEFDDSDDSDLGYSYSKPQIMRLNDGNFYAVLGSGYNNTNNDANSSGTGDAVLYILNIETGKVVSKITTGYGTDDDPNETGSRQRGNGLATIKGFDKDDDGLIDQLYAGDLFGNLWKFDLSSNDPDDWKYKPEKENPSTNYVANPLKLFTALDHNGKAQPITSQVQVRNVKKTPMIFFGTGKLLEGADTLKVNISRQSFYAIKDQGALVSGRGSLLEQNIIYQAVMTFTGNPADNREVRLSSNNSISESYKGWFMDLHTPVISSNQTLSYEEEGEQVVVNALLRGEKIFFATNAPNEEDDCLPSSKNFVFELNAASGARLNYVAVDLNNDGQVDDKDGVVRKDSDGNNIVVSVSGQGVSSNHVGTFVDVLDKNGKPTNKEIRIYTCINGNECLTTQQLALKKKDETPWVRTSWRMIRSQ